MIYVFVGGPWGHGRTGKPVRSQCQGVGEDGSLGGQVVRSGQIWVHWN